MHTVGDETHMALFREVACPNVIEHLLADLAVQPANTINLLASVTCKDTHTELFAVIFRIGTAHTDELVPCDTEFLRVATHVFTEKSFLEIVVTCRHRGMNSVQTAGTHQLQGLVECQSLFDVIAQTLQVAQCSMPFVAMVDILLDTQFLQ